MGDSRTKMGLSKDPRPVIEEDSSPEITISKQQPFDTRLGKPQNQIWEIRKKLTKRNLKFLKRRLREENHHEQDH